MERHLRVSGNATFGSAAGDHLRVSGQILEPAREEAAVAGEVSEAAVVAEDERRADAVGWRGHAWFVGDRALGDQVG